jgi:hypothetical protein
MRNWNPKMVHWNPKVAKIEWMRLNLKWGNNGPKSLRRSRLLAKKLYEKKTYPSP